MVKSTPEMIKNKDSPKDVSSKLQIKRHQKLNQVNQIKADSKDGHKRRLQKLPKEMQDTKSSFGLNGSIKCRQGQKEGNLKKANKSGTTKDEVYNIESLLKKEGSMYLVKWENYSHRWNSWEPKAAIPAFIVKVTLFKDQLYLILL